MLKPIRGVFPRGWAWRVSKICSRIHRLKTPILSPWFYDDFGRSLLPKTAPYLQAPKYSHIVLYEKPFRGAQGIACTGPTKTSFASLTRGLGLVRKNTCCIKQAPQNGRNLVGWRLPKSLCNCMMSNGICIWQFYRCSGSQWTVFPFVGQKTYKKASSYAGFCILLGCIGWWIGGGEGYRKVCVTLW